MVLPKLNCLKVTIFGLLLTLACFTFDVQAAFAHYPHDDFLPLKYLPIISKADLPNFNRPHFSDLSISQGYSQDRTVFAGTAAGLFVTRDEGQSWRKLVFNAATKHGYVDAVAISPNYQSDRTLVISFRGKGLFKSVDGGITFSQIGDDLLNNNHSLANMYGFWPPTTAIKFSPAYSSNRTIYGVAENLFKSTDGGNTWSNLPLPTP